MTACCTGITEAFVHAVLDERALKAANALLVVCAAAHVACSVVLVQLAGALGLVAADTLNMGLRIAYSLWCVLTAVLWSGVQAHARLSGWLFNKVAWAQPTCWKSLRLPLCPQVYRPLLCRCARVSRATAAAEQRHAGGLRGRVGLPRRLKCSIHVAGQPGHTRLLGGGGPACRRWRQCAGCAGRMRVAPRTRHAAGRAAAATAAWCCSQR